jgi:hypothetical protein
VTTQSSLKSAYLSFCHLCGNDEQSAPFPFLLAIHFRKNQDAIFILGYCFEENGGHPLAG